MLALLATALAGPPAPLSASDILAQSTVVAEAEAVRTELQTLPEGAERRIPVPWTEYRVVRALRGTKEGEVYRLQQNQYCMPGQGPLYARVGGKVVNPEHENKPVNVDDYLVDADGKPRRVWLMLRDQGQGMVPVRWIPAVTKENTAIIEAEVGSPGTEKAAKTLW